MTLAATQYPSFSGKWVLDNKASDPADALLKAQGASWLERQAAKTAKITQEITQSNTELTVKITNPMKSTTEVLKLDGTPTISEGDRVGKVSTKTFWGEDKITLISVIEPTSNDQGFKQIKVSRKLQDQGKTMAQLVEMKLNDGQVVKANRIFRKV